MQHVRPDGLMAKVVHRQSREEAIIITNDMHGQRAMGWGRGGAQHKPTQALEM